MRKLLLLALVLAACGKKKDATPAAEPGSASGASAGSSGSGSSASGSAASGSAEAPPPKPTDTAAGSGCKLPDELAGPFTITKGCTVKLDGSLTVPENMMLTIEEGVKVQIAKGERVDIKGGLVVTGTDAAPVVFTSADASPNPGDWEGIVFEATTLAGTSVDHARVEYAGKAGSWGSRAVHLIDGLPPKRVAITNTQITHSAGPGLTIDDDKTIPVKLENNTFSDDAKTCIEAPTDVWSTIGVNKCGDQLAHVTSGNLTRTATWPKLDTAYVIDSLEITGPDVPILTLPDGATIKMAKGGFIHIGADGGGLVATKVTFTSAEAIPDAGDWGGIAIDAKATGTKIDGCTIEYAGAGYAWGSAPIEIVPPVDKIAGRVTITNLTIRKSSNAGIEAPEGKCGPYGEAASGNKVEGAPSVCKK